MKRPPRSEATTIRYMRNVLRHAKTALQVARNPQSTASQVESWANTVLPMIAEVLAPRLHSSSGGRRARGSR